MYPRTSYEMTEADLEAILDACKPVPYMVIGGHAPSSQQDNANAAWARLGQKMGFDSMTVEPVQGKGLIYVDTIWQTPRRKWRAVLGVLAGNRAWHIDRHPSHLARLNFQMSVASKSNSAFAA